MSQFAASSLSPRKAVELWAAAALSLLFLRLVRESQGLSGSGIT